MTGGRPSPQVKGKCPYCGRLFAVNRNGRIRVHWLRATATAPPGRKCGGSGQVAS